MSSHKRSLIFESFFSAENLLRIFEERIKDAKFIGLDGVKASAFSDHAEDEIEVAIKKIHSGNYSFTRYREKLILKSYKKPPRQIAIPTIRDALVLRALCDYLTSLYDDCRMKPPHDVIKQIATKAQATSTDDCFLRMDVVNFYPSIVHCVLLEQLNKRVPDQLAIELISRALSTPIGFDGPDNQTIGVPQGLSISNILSMVYLLDFDFSCDLNYEYFRYVDDIVILADKDKITGIHTDVEGYLAKKLHLKTHPLEDKVSEKTMISSVSSGTSYLGYKISNTGLSIRDKSYKKMFRAIVGCLRTLRGTASVDQVLWRLNLIVTGCRFESRSVGWVFFFRQSTDMAQFYRMDAFLKKQMAIYGLKEKVGNVKTFAKAYREIRYNREKTTYVPNFDNFTLADKISVISLIRGFSKARLAKMERPEIDEFYWSIVRKQVAKLERETVDFGASSGGS